MNDVDEIMYRSRCAGLITIVEEYFPISEHIRDKKGRRLTKDRLTVDPQLFAWKNELIEILELVRSKEL